MGMDYEGTENTNAFRRAVTANVPDEAFNDYIMTRGWNRLTYSGAAGEHGNIVVSGKLYAYVKSTNSKGYFINEWLPTGSYILYADGYCDICDTAEEQNFILGRDSNGELMEMPLKKYADKITELYVHEGAQFFKGSIGKMTNLTRVTLPATMKYVSGGFFSGATKLEIVELPYLEQVLESCFADCTSLREVHLPVLKHVGDDCFNGCTALEVFDASPTGSIGSRAFKGCTSLESIDLTNVAQRIGNDAFAGCTGLKEVSIANYICDNIFEGCSSLTTVNIPGGVSNLGDRAFTGTSLKTINTTCPDPPTGIVLSLNGARASEPFYGLDLSQITLKMPREFIPVYKEYDYWKDMNIVADEKYQEEFFPRGGEIGTCGFWLLDENGVLTYDLWESMQSVYLKEPGLYNWFVKKIVFTDECTSLQRGDFFAYYGGHDTFTHCEKLVLGKNVTEIGSWKFILLMGLKHVYCYAENPPQLYYNKDNEVLHTFDMDAVKENGVVLHVLKKAGVKERYQQAYDWMDFPRIMADLVEGEEPPSDGISIAAVTVSPDGYVTVPVTLQSEEPVSDVAFTVKVPEGVSVAGMAAGQSGAREIDGQRRVSFNLGSITIDVTPLSEQNYRVSVTDADGKALPTGQLMNMLLHASSSLSLGDFYRLRLADVQLTTTNGETINADAVIATLTVALQGKPGDVNSDGTVDVADIASVISVMAGSAGDSPASADVNGDGTVDVADIATIISIMAGETAAE